jgi:hypothetical protein
MTKVMAWSVTIALCLMIVTRIGRTIARLIVVGYPS